MLVLGGGKGILVMSEMGAELSAFSGLKLSIDVLQSYLCTLIRRKELSCRPCTLHVPPYFHRDAILGL